MRGHSGTFLAVDKSPEPFSGCPPLGLLFGDSICRGPTLPPAAANDDGLILHFTLVHVRQKWTHSCFSASLAVSPGHAVMGWVTPAPWVNDPF